MRPFATLVFFTVVSVFAAKPVSAELTTVSATVPDNDGPTTPILISPGNNSYVTDSTPNFTWTASTDANGIGSYVLSLDGSPLFSSIPTTATDNAQYTLTYDNIQGRYTLTPKAVISDGAHTWKIRALDTLNNGTDSATWNFTMDTQSPTFVINKFGALNVSISAQDASTIPGTPLLLQDNEPLILATGEASSSVAVNLVIPGDPSQNFATNITGGGAWSLQLGILPRNVTMTLNITITDLAGNVSVLNGLQFLIQNNVIVFPPATPSPSPTASPVVSPTPSATPQATPDTSPQPSPTPTAVLEASALPQPSPLITIPVIPPREIAFEIAQEFIESLPEPVKLLVAAIPKEVVKVVQDAAPISGLLVSAAIPAASAVAIGSQFGTGLSFEVIIKILQALGLIPSGKPQGLVFNSKSYEPIPFALLTITNPNSKLTPVVETVVTDVFGVYRGVKLPPDTYQITVSHQDFRFPSSVVRSQYVTLADFYQGEPFTVTSNETEQLFLIPLDPIRESGRVSLKTQLRIGLAQLGKLTGILSIPLFLLSGFLALLFPSPWNTGVFFAYTLLVGYKAVGWFKVPILTGTVIDQQGNPVENAIIRLSLSQTNQLATVLSTDKKGGFKVYGAKEKYQLSATKSGFVWVNEQSVLSFYEVDATTSPQTVIITMAPLEQIYSNLF